MNDGIWYLNRLTSLFTWLFKSLWLRLHNLWHEPCSWHAPWHSCLSGGSQTVCLGKPGGETKAVGWHLLGCSPRPPRASLRMDGCLSVCLSVGTVELCHDWLQRGSPGCAGSSDVQWQQPGSPKSPEYLKHPCTTLYRCWLLNSEVLELCCYNFILIYRIQWHSWWYSHQRVTPD